MMIQANFHPSIFSRFVLIRVVVGQVPIFNSLWAGGRVHTGQVASQLQGFKETEYHFPQT